jgi:hypothetical protein
MNLHQIVSGAVGSVNPMLQAFVRVSTGATIAADGKRTPTYARAVFVPAQIQPLSTGDIRQLDSLNIQGVEKAIYLNGHVDGLVREQNKGGDLIVLQNGTNAGAYLVSVVLEAWPDWTKCGVVMQSDGDVTPC